MILVFTNCYNFFKSFDFILYLNINILPYISIVDLIFASFFIFFLFLIFLNFLNNFFNKEQKIKIIKFILKRIFISLCFFTLFNFNFVLHCIEVKSLKKNDYLIISGVLFTGIAGYTVYKYFGSNIISKSINKIDSEFKSLNNEVVMYKHSQSLLIPGLKPEDSFFFSLIKTNNTNLTNLAESLLFLRNLDDEKNSIKLLNSIQLSAENTDRTLIFQNNFFEESFNRTPHLAPEFTSIVPIYNYYKMNQLKFYKDMIELLEDRLYLGRYNNFHTFIKVDYFNILDAQSRLKNILTLTFNSYLDLLLVTSQKFELNSLYVKHFINKKQFIDYTLVSALPYYNSNWGPSLNTLNKVFGKSLAHEFSIYNFWSFKHLLSHVTYLFNQNSNNLYSSLTSYHNALMFSSSFYSSSRKEYIFEKYNTSLIKSDLIYDYTSFIKTITIPLLIDPNISTFSVKIIIFKLKIISLKVSCIFLYPPMFILNKLFNINNPIHYDSFIYSLIYVLKLKFIF